MVYLDANGTPQMAFVHNTAAWQDREAGTFRFFWKTEAGIPASLFSPANKEAWYWPSDGFVHNGSLYLVNKVIVRTPVNTPMFGFVWASDDLLKIVNPDASPADWQIETTALPDSVKSVLIGTACITNGRYVYFWTSLPKHVHGRSLHPTGVCRSLKSALSTGDMGKFEFWDGSKWSKNADDSAILFADGAPEMTVTRLKDTPYLVLTYMPPLSSEICVRFALKPEGPWSEPLKVYDCPEADITVFGEKVAVYSAKAHPELATEDDELVISYCSNPGSFEAQAARPDIYWPRLISVKLKPN